MQEQNLLTEYKKYDYLNQERITPLIKILVSYIKPSFLFKSEILTPIHLGRAVEKENSKDGIVSDEDIKWLHENCIGDDDFEGNISAVNRRIGFLTGTYWAWKNYEKLGNPEYFGSYGYRRLFSADCLQNLSTYDLVAPEARKIQSTFDERLIDYLGKDFYYKVLKVLIKLCPDDESNIKTYLGQHNVYFDEIYLMKKTLFVQFCEWIFPILFELIKIPQVKRISEYKLTTKNLLISQNDVRDIAYIAEFLTGYFIFKTEKNMHCTKANVIVLNKDKNINIFNVLRKRVQNYDESQSC